MGVLKKFTPKPRDYGLEAQQAAEAHLEALWEAADSDDEHAMDDIDIAAPWCGCTTCIVREVLHAAWPILQEAVKAGVE